MNNTTQSPDDNASESAPSALCTDCPQEIYLEFSVVNYAGEQVASLQEFELDGMPVRQNTIIGPVKSGKHTLKALDGNELRQEILGRRHAPKRPKTTPAATQAYQQNKNYYYSTKDSLWNGLYIFTYPYGRPFRNGYLIKYIIEIEYGIDYCILMVFLDNHSGNIHGSGHAGALIINGQTQRGMFSDFGPYHLILKNGKETHIGDVRTYEPIDLLLEKKNGKLNQKILGNIFHFLNIEYGSNTLSKNHCILSDLLNGPQHEFARNYHEYSPFIKKGFKINGLIAWAGYILPGGAYKIMEQYINKTDNKITSMQKNNKNSYKLFKFNCMTYAINILCMGLGKAPLSEKEYNINHPNTNIQKYINEAQLCGIYNDRHHEGMPDAVDGHMQSKKPGITHLMEITWFLSFRKLHAHP